MKIMDKQIKLNIDFGYDRVADKNIPSDRQVTLNYLGYIVSLGYKEGLNPDKRRIWNKIYNKAEEAIHANEEVLNVNSYEHAFLKQAFEKALVPANESKNVTLVETEVFDAKDGVQIQK